MPVSRRDSLNKKLLQLEKQLIYSHKEEAARKEEIAIAKIKYFYKYAKSKSKTKTEIGPFHVEGNYVEESKMKA